MSESDFSLRLCSPALSVYEVPKYVCVGHLVIGLGLRGIRKRLVAAMDLQRGLGSQTPFAGL